MRKCSIIRVNDIHVERSDNDKQKTFSVLDASVVAPNPGRIIGSPSKMSSPPTDSQARDGEPVASYKEDEENKWKTNEKPPAVSEESSKDKNAHDTSRMLFVADWTTSQHLHKMPQGEGMKVKRKWLRRETNLVGKRCYCPQVGDSVVYIPKAHKYTLDKFPVDGYTYPWKSWPAESSWPAVRCTVAHIRYRFPYKQCYNPLGSEKRIAGVAAIVRLEITGVPIQSTERRFPWPATSFIPALEKHYFEATIFECGEEEFIIPEYIYTWRINELEKAIESNDGVVDGLNVTVQWPFISADNKNGGDDTVHKEYKSKLMYLNEREDESHLQSSGHHALVMECQDNESKKGDSIFAVGCAWNVTVKSPSAPFPTVPTISKPVKNKIQNAFNKVLKMDPKIKSSFFEAVDTRKFSDYSDFIEVPMHLSFIRKRLQNNYYTNKQSVGENFLMILCQLFLITNID